MAKLTPTEPNAERQTTAPRESSPPDSTVNDAVESSDVRSTQESSGSQDTIKRPTAAAHWCFLILSAAVILASISMRHEGETSVFLPGTSVPLPSICTFKLLTGLDCPGCGLTRSFINIGHGQWLRAAKYNLAGFLVYMMVAIQIPWHAAQLFRYYRRQPRLVFPCPWAFVTVMVIGLMIQWIVKLVVAATVV